VSRMLDRGRRAAPPALLLLLVAGATPAVAAPGPAYLALTVAAPVTSAGCYKEVIAYTTAAGKFYASVDAFNWAVDHGTAKDVQAAGATMDSASETMVWAGILLVVCLITLM